MGLIKFLFGSEEAAATLLHKALWTAVQSGLSLLLADGLLDVVDIGALQTAAVAGIAGALVVVKEFARKQVASE